MVVKARPKVTGLGCIMDGMAKVREVINGGAGRGAGAGNGSGLGVGGLRIQVRNSNWDLTIKVKKYAENGMQTNVMHPYALRAKPMCVTW